MSRTNINAVFYADSYHPIQAGSIDGTDILPHDNGIYRAFLCSSAGLYDPFGDSKVTGDPYCTVFVGRLSHLTTEGTLRKAMSKYGRVKNLRLVRHIVTGASRGYAFIEYETEREMHRAYEHAHHSIIDDSEIIVDYNRQQLMPGWIPRRLGGGLGGKKESGQLRFGGRERPFRAPLRPVPFEDLKRLGIPPPPEGRYMSRFQVPSPPRKARDPLSMEEPSSRRPADREPTRVSSIDRDYPQKRTPHHSSKRHSVEREETHGGRSSADDRARPRKNSIDKEEHSHRRSSLDMEIHSRRERNADRERHSHKRRCEEREEHSHKHHRHGSRSHRREGQHGPTGRDRSSDTLL